MTGPAVSVVVPVRNGERYLREALDSILSQTPRVGEIIVVDDGSDDGSVAVAAAAGDRVRIFSQPPLGIGAARNRGLAACRGEFVALLDADDLWSDQALSVWLGAFAADPGLEMVLGRVSHFVSPDVEPELGARLVPPADLAPAYMPGGWLARRRVVDRIGAFREDIVSGDMIDWLIRAQDSGVRERVLAERVLWRRLHADNHGRRERAARSDYARVLKSALDRRRSTAAMES